MSPYADIKPAGDDAKTAPRTRRAPQAVAPSPGSSGDDATLADARAACRQHRAADVRQLDGQRPAQRSSRRRRSGSVAWPRADLPRRRRRPAPDRSHGGGLGRAARGRRRRGPLDVLDIGGGTGGFAVRLAELGHRVTVVDPSPDALAALDRRAGEAGSSRSPVAGRPGQRCSTWSRPGSADLVLCHGVLEVVDDPAAALATLGAVLRPGGTAQPAGRPAARRRGRPGDGRPLRPGPARPRRPGRPVGSPRPAAAAGSPPTRLAALLGDAGLTVGAVHGVRVFADLVPGALLDLEPGATAALVELEHAVADPAGVPPARHPAARARPTGPDRASRSAWAR